MHQHGIRIVTSRRQLPRSRATYLASMGMFLLLFFAGGMSEGNCVMSPSGMGGRGPVIVEDDHILGSPDAKVTVVSYECFQ